MKPKTIFRVLGLAFTIGLLIMVARNAHWSVTVLLTIQWIGNESMAIWMEQVNKKTGI